MRQALWLWMGVAVFLGAAGDLTGKTGRGDLRLTARVVDAGGRPGDASITFWRAVEETDKQASGPGEAKGVTETSQCWRDPVSGKTWEPFHHYGPGKEVTQDKLTPGHYCVAAALGNGPTPYGISEIIHLDGRTPETRVVITLQSGPTLTVTAADALSHLAVTLFQVRLEREDGFPVAQWSNASWGMWSREEIGRLVLPGLAPGRYRLDVRCPARYASQPEYKLQNGPMTIQVEAGVDQQIGAALVGEELPESVLNERWPFVVTGRVTDEQGRGMEGVKIIAHCGMGTLLPTGQATSGPDGGYLLRFGPGMRVRGGGRWGTGLQAATISPGKTGYAEANLHRQGDLLMAEKMPDPKEKTGWKAQPEKIVLPNKPFNLDFVMVRVATVKGQLVDANNRPLAGRRVHVSGKELPPSSSILADTKTDAEGRFQFDAIPTGRAWWISLAERREEARTVPLTFEQSIVYQVKLRLGTQAGKPSLELVSATPE